MSEGSKIPVRAVFKTRHGYKHAGAVIAKPNCWSMLKGGLTVDASGIAELYFEVLITYLDFFQYFPIIFVCLRLEKIIGNYLLYCVTSFRQMTRRSRFGSIVSLCNHSHTKSGSRIKIKALTR